MTTPPAPRRLASAPARAEPALLRPAGPRRVHRRPGTPKAVEDSTRTLRPPAGDLTAADDPDGLHRRGQQDDDRALEGRTVQLTGFVTPDKNGTWDLTRLLVACCAADAQSLTVAMHGVKAPPADTWVKVTGTWHPQGTLGTPSAALALDVTSLQRIPQPPSPYLDRAPALSS